MWIREVPDTPEVPKTSSTTRPRAELPGDLVADIRTATAPLGARQRERFVTMTSEALAAYERGRYEEASRRMSPVAEVAPRVAGVRELAGLAAYRAGRWRAAALHLKAHYEMSGDVEHLPALMDCERALKHPTNVRRLFETVRAASPPAEVLSEARIVMASSLADKGKFDEAVDAMGDAAKKVRNPAYRHVRQWYVLADLYERSGDLARARELFTRVAIADPGAFDVDERLDELGARPGKPRSKAR